MVENATRSAASSHCAASRSWMDVAVTTTPSSRPLTSTAMCHLRPSVLFAPSHPRLDRGTVSAAGTVCESMTAAVGHRPRPPCVRVRSRSVSCMRCHAPSERRPRIRPSAAGIPPVAAATRYHPEPGKRWHPESFGDNASRACRRDLPSCPAAAATVPGSPTRRRSATTTDTSRSNVRATDGAGTTSTARSVMAAFVGAWARAATSVITDQTRSPPIVLQHSTAHDHEFSNTF